MKGCDFVKKVIPAKTKSHPSVLQCLYIAVFALFVLTILSTHLVCGLYARYTISDTDQQGARVATMTGITLKEVSVSVIDDIDEQVTNHRIYQFGTGTQNGFAYEYVVPGVDIPKNPYISTDGKNEVPCYIYLEIAEDLPDTVTYSIREEWTEMEGITGRHGGTMYYYRNVIKANEKCEKLEIIENNLIYVSQYFKAENSFEMNLYGYMIQTAEGCSAEDLFRNHVEVGE